MNRRLLMDDLFLLFGLLCNIAMTVLAFQGLPYNYSMEELVLHPELRSFVTIDPAEIHRAMDLNAAALTLSWIAVYAVKLSLLTFFRSLVDRLPRFDLYVKSVMGFHLMVFVYVVISTYSLCTTWGLLVVGKHSIVIIPENLLIEGLPDMKLQPM